MEIDSSNQNEKEELKTPGNYSLVVLWLIPSETEDDDDETIGLHEWLTSLH